MNHIKRLANSLLVTLVLSLAVVPTAFAISKDEAINVVKRKHPGKLIKISGEKAAYNVRLLQKNGRVINVKVDKKTGQIIK